MNADAAASFAGRVEAWSYSVLWIPEAMGRDPLVHAAWLLANTTRLVVATGIANIHAREAAAMAAAGYTLNEQSGGRFLLGIGVSHSTVVENVHGKRYGRPIETMRAYLDGLARARHIAKHAASSRIILAALGPRMLALAGELADGAHPYCGTPEHTRRAREIIGPEKLLCPEQKILFETDPAKARLIARGALSPYLEAKNYRNHWLRLGFVEGDFADGGTDRLIDALVLWGDETKIRRRLQEHWDAGADHVCIQALPSDGAFGGKPDERVLEFLAPARDDAS
jgi:probable F420-dependent oxidoreductase